MLTTDDLQALLPDVVQIALNAGEQIMAIYNDSFTVTDKADKTPVTEADMAAHRTIVSALEMLTPNTPVLSEESGDIPYTTRQKWSQYWLVDPLDGTREFIKRNGEFTVNIAFIHQDESWLGVVYAPFLKVIYAAVQGKQVTKQQADFNDPMAQAQQAPVEPIQVRPLDMDQLIVAGSRSHADAKLGRYLKRLGRHDLITMGSSLKSCLVAEGRADLYPRIGLTSEWDTAAAQCIVEQAGGQITDTKGQRLRYNTKASLLNPHFFVFGEAHDWSQYLDKPNTR